MIETIDDLLLCEAPLTQKTGNVVRRLGSIYRDQEQLHLLLIFQRRSHHLHLSHTEFTPRSEENHREGALAYEVARVEGFSGKIHQLKRWDAYIVGRLPL